VRFGIPLGKALHVYIIQRRTESYELELHINT
jgi:hypothetical protein